VRVLERITGSSVDFVHKPCSDDPTARSSCGGWQIDLNTRDRDGAQELASYIECQHDKHPAPPEIKGKAFGTSQAIGKSAQERERPMLEARAKRCAWIGETARRC
jgi:hypothetical protein